MSDMPDVADPFEVMQKVNALFGRKQARRDRKSVV
jgi:hypothetical protein